MTLLIIGLAMAGPIVAAARGMGYRGLYIGITLVAGLFGWIALIATPTDLAAINSTDEAERRGAELLLTYGAMSTLVLFALAFGALVGAAVFRPKASRT